MATAVHFLGWNRPHPGTEEKAYNFVMTEGVEVLKKWQGKWFERMECIGLTPHGGDMNGCVILFGERAKLDELRRTDEFEGFSMKLGSMFDRYGVVPGVTWEGMQGVMARFNKAR
jgi:hypothetical protein